jgi:ribosome recycling factor
MYNFKNFQEKLLNIKEWLSIEYSKIRTGRANSAILDGIKVSAYGVLTPIIQVASIVSEDAKTLRVSPYDLSQISSIEKAINDAQLGVSVASDSNGVRVIFPDLTAERRDMFIKQAGKKLEEARISLRIEREKVWNEIQAQEKSGKINQDIKFKSRDEMQKLVDKITDDFNSMFEKKEAEIKSQ